jgi:amidase
VQGAPAGKLRGKRVALKDNVCLAGVPMMNGASSLEGYVPDVDAPIVTRILDAGGTIAGKVHCEYFCFSGGSHTSAAGPVQNPRRPGYSAGGSSSGARRWWRPARSTWPSAVTRAARSASRPPTAGCTA